MSDRQTLTLISSAARTANGDSGPQENSWARGARFTLDISAASGTTPTLDLKIQYFDETSSQWLDLNGASFVQKSATGTDDLLVYPGIAETANRAVSTVLPGQWRVAWTVGGTGPSFTFSLGVELFE